MESLLERKELKFVFVGGKGGVGKTTSSSAIAIQFSYDRKVLLLSTDPAHSLSDAFRMEFKGTPTVVPGIPNLSVMEVNPESSLQSEIAMWAKLAADSGYDELVSNVKEFQEWLSGVPGIDEATALSNVITYVESGAYDTIVFDTAPTGHTLKLLQLPQILQIGLDKLNSWQSKLWGYYSALKGSLGKGNVKSMQKMVSERLEQYKTGVEKIGVMLKDQVRTNFVVVCIAELLSINESQRLLNELVRHQVNVSHVVVNQLVVNNLEPSEMKELEAILVRANTTDQEEGSLLRRMRASIQLCNARRSIQQKYLAALRASSEVKTNDLKLVEMPLLSSEVTGAEALLNFSQMLVKEGYRSSSGPSELEGWLPQPTVIYEPDKEKESTHDETEVAPEKKRKIEVESSVGFETGDTVIITGLGNAPQYNGSKGRILGGPTDQGRFRVRISFNGSNKTLALRPTNLQMIKKQAKPTAPTQSSSVNTSAPAPSTGTGGLFDTVMNDPEVQEKLKNPKFARALADVKANPANFLMYMGDPEIGPFISKMMGKLGGGGGLGGLFG